MCDISLMAFRELTRVPPSKRFRSLRVIGLGGERVDRSDFERFCRSAPEGCLLQNGYGSTETRTISQYLLNHHSDFPGNLVPVGWPVERKTVVLRTEDGSPAPAGESGEITVESGFLSSGYWRRPELTAQVFYENPATRDRVYRTGDLGRWLPDRRLVHLGRKDSQVKVRGYRVETLEVEAALAGFAGCRDSAVVPSAGADGHLQLVAFIVLTEGQTTTIKEVREYLKARLPAYSIPSRFFVVNALPRLANGKVDLAQLRSTVIPERALGTTAHVASSDSIERAIARLAEEVFGVARPGVHDDLFELGCDSVSAVTFLARLEEDLGRKVPAEAFGRNPTIAGLACCIREHGYDSPNVCLIPINAEGTRAPLFYFPGLIGSGENWFHLSRHLGPDQPVYSLQAQGLDGKRPPHRTISEMAGAFAAAIQRIHPDRSVNLLGYSAAGLVAHECACQLLLLGRKVNCLILVACLDLGACRPLWQFLRRVNGRLGRYRDRLRSHGISGRSTAPTGKAAKTRTTVEVAIRRAMNGHHPARFGGSTVYIEPSKSDLLVPQRCWKPWRSLVSGSFEVCMSPGNHLTVVDRENTPELARVLRAHMG
jgi:thioesterase domain-containing protein/acyl carrier protein